MSAEWIQAAKAAGWHSFIFAGGNSRLLYPSGGGFWYGVKNGRTAIVPPLMELRKP